MVKLGSTIVLLVTILCGVQQFSPVFCDECNTFDCILSEIISYIPFMSSSAYEEYYDGDYYDDYYYDNFPITTEEIIIIPLTPSAPEPFFPSFSGENYDSAISSPSPSAYEDYYYNEGESGLSGYDYSYESASAVSGQEAESSLLDDILGYLGIGNSTSGTALNASAPSSFSSSATDSAGIPADTYISASGSGNSSGTPASSLSGSASSWGSGSATEASATTTNSASAASAPPSAPSSASDNLSYSGSAASAPVSSVSGSASGVSGSASGVSSGSSGSPVSAPASGIESSASALPASGTTSTSSFGSGSVSASSSTSGSATITPISSATGATNISATASASDFNPLGMFGTSGNQVIVN